MRPFLALLIVLFSFSPSMTLAAQTDGADLALPSSKIYFSKETFISGDTVRIYATVENDGTEDMSGYVLFYQGSEEIGKSQIVSVVAGGEYEQVWVDFSVPYGPFNIRAEIKGTDPTDINSSNDIALTGLFTPTIDEDRDGVSDEDDNCPEDANGNQKDSDQDGKGDACEDDDDNDGLSDAVEEEMATDSTAADTDGDGVRDATDAYPTDASRQTKEVATVTPPPSTATPVTIAVPSTTQAEASSLAPSTPVSPSDTEGEIPSPDIHLATGGKFQISPRAAFAFIREDWKTYSFRSLSVLGDGATLAWDFGDGVTSAADEVTHVFRQPGTYHVTLRITSADGSSVEDMQVIEISSFHLGNPLIQAALGVLILLLCLSCALALRRSRRPTASRSLATPTPVVSAPETSAKSPARRTRKRS